MRKYTSVTRSAIIALILSLLLAVTAMPQTGWATTGTGSTHYIAVASDRHSTTDAIEIAMKGMPSSVEYVCLNGDMVDAAGRAPRTSSSEAGAPPDGGGGSQSQEAYNTSTVLKEVQSLFPSLTKDNVSIVYGSHDANATDDAGIMKCAALANPPAGSDSPAISEGKSGLIYTGKDGNEVAYYVYGVSYYDMINAEVATAAAANFKSWASSSGVDQTAPVIVISHVPLHAKRNDNKGGAIWTDVLNEVAQGGVSSNDTIVREVAYLHGHNHTVEKTEYFVKPGGNLDVQGASESVSKTIQFTYITAGYLRDNQTATLVAVEADHLSFTKYKGYRVSFDSQGGSDVDGQAVSGGARVTEPAAPQRSGYVFTGWYKEAACENKWDFGTAVNENVTLYAGWVKGAKPDAPGLAATVYASKKKVTLSWAAASNASDYRISYKAAGSANWSRMWTNGALSYTIKGLTKKGLYDFKVVSAAESSDRLIYSADSNEVHRYISSLSKVKLRSRKRAVKVSWAKDKKASGYEIIYSTSKNMDNAVTISVSKSKKSYKIKGLNKGKRYYVRVRPIVQNSGTVYYGAYSSRKSARAR